MKKLTIILLLFPLFSFGQVNLDSLWVVWSDESQADTARLKALHKYTWDGYLFTQPDSAFSIAQLQLDFAKSKGLKKQMAGALNTQGVSFYLQGDYASAIDYYIRSSTIYEEIRNKLGLSNCLNNIGIIYYYQGDYAGAIAYYTRSLTIREEIGDKQGKSISLNNIGIIYKNQGDYAGAIAYSVRALTTAQEVGAVIETRDAANALYRAYKAIGRHKPALEMYELYVVARDSIDIEENQKEVIRQEFKYKFEKAQLIAEQARNEELRMKN